MIVSIVTPSFNQGHYLAETIESVLGQEGDFHLDYLVIDGASTDDSVHIIKHYEKLLAEGCLEIKCRGIRFRWLSEKDRGQTDALKKGFRLAEGNILAWLNSDDVYLPGALQTVSSFFRAHPKTALLFGAAHYCDTEGKVTGSYPTEDFDFKKLARSNFFCQPSTFFRKEAFEAVGGLDDSFQYAMDFDLFVRIVKKFECQYLPQYLSKYRLHDEAKTMRAEFLFENHEDALRVVLKHFGCAPLNRVYGSCIFYCLCRFPQILTRFKLLTIGIALILTLFRSLWVNRGLCREDLKLLRMSYFRKLFKDRTEIIRR